MNIKITPSQRIDAKIVLPGSKYIANRLLPMCALASSPSVLRNVVVNDDINTAIQGLSNIGYQITREPDGLFVKPRKQSLQHPASMHTSHSGTFSRFVTAVAALDDKPITINCSEKMATRPMQPLFDSLIELGVIVESPNQCLPAVITGPVKHAVCQLDASTSSQYLSGLLIIAPLLPQGLTVEMVGKQVSLAYVDMTIKLMEKMGITVEQYENRYVVKAGQKYQGIDFSIPGDPVSSTYFMGAAAISGGKIKIDGFDFDSVQGESKFYQVLQKMGCKVEQQDNQLVVEATQRLSGIEIDMGEMPDAVQTLAAVACYAEGVTKITNIAHLAYKESNRISDTAKELRKTGIQVEDGEDFLIIHGGQPKSAEIETHEDHRMAMSMALLGIKTPDIVIKDAQVVEKSFPTYWQALKQVGIESESL